jgi:hypothetical protein
MRNIFPKIVDFGGSTKQGHYQAKAHLADMVSLLGHPPLELIAKSQSMSGWYQWPGSAINADGVTCENAEQYFEGPFFDHNGIWNSFILVNLTVVLPCY